MSFWFMKLCPSFEICSSRWVFWSCFGVAVVSELWLSISYRIDIIIENKTKREGEKKKEKEYLRIFLFIFYSLDRLFILCGLRGWCSLGSLGNLGSLSCLGWSLSLRLSLGLCLSLRLSLSLCIWSFVCCCCCLRSGWSRDSCCCWSRRWVC